MASHTLLVKMWIGTATLENCQQLLQLNTCLLYGLASLFLDNTKKNACSCPPKLKYYKAQEKLYSLLPKPKINPKVNVPIQENTMEPYKEQTATTCTSMDDESHRTHQRTHHFFCCIDRDDTGSLLGYWKCICSTFCIYMHLHILHILQHFAYTYMHL